MRYHEVFFRSGTIKVVYIDFPREPKFVAAVARWSLFRGWFILIRFKMMVVVGR